MKRQNRFLIALLSAGITFATLTATIGTDHWKRGYYGHHGYWHHYDHHYNHCLAVEEDILDSITMMREQWLDVYCPKTESQ